MPHKLQPLTAPFADDIAALLAHYPQVDGYLLSLFRTFANSARFLKKGVPNLLDADSPLSLRDREITILRITANRNCEYEWGVHVAIFAKAAGLTQAQIRATRCDAWNAPCWDDDGEQLLLRALDQLCRDGRMDDDTRTAFETRWTQDQQLEILALAGAYQTISFVANTAQLPSEDFAARFPA